ncbi:MAG: hypothetical protein WCK34_06685 [Bacteroidota bacterium]
MAEREIILEQVLKVLKDIETNTCDKQFIPDTNMLEKKVDHLIELHEKEIELLKALGKDRCTCKKSKIKKEKKEKRSKKEK